MCDDNGLYMTGGGSGPFYGIRPKDPAFPIKYLLGILNSSLFGWIIKTQSTNLRGGYIKFSKQYIETAPIVPPDKVGLGKAQALIDLVDEAINLRKRFADAKLPHDKEVLQRQIKMLLERIDIIVFQLYGVPMMRQKSLAKQDKLSIFNITQFLHTIPQD
jgi:hypothetical protein